MTIAIAATPTKTATHVCMPTPSPHEKGGHHSNRARSTVTPMVVAYVRSLGFGLAEICFAAGFHSGGERILLTHGHVFAALDQFVGALAQLARFALRVILAFLVFVREKLAGFFNQPPLE